MVEIPEEYIRYFKGAGQFFNHSWLKLATLCWGESEFDPNAVSEAGARGLAQFMEGTWDAFGHGSWDNAFVPNEAIIAEARYLDYCRSYIASAGRYGPEWEFVAYNCGHNFAKTCGKWGDAPERTRLWIVRIMPQWAAWLEQYGSIV